jgi:hypothetical protein
MKDPQLEYTGSLNAAKHLRLQGNRSSTESFPAGGGTPVLVSRATPTAAAINLAREYNVTLMGYVQGNSGFVYAGEDRLVQGEK